MTFELLSDSDGSPLIRITGELDMQTIPELEAGVESIMTAGAGRLVVDVSGVNFADSSAIALWVRWANYFRQIEIREPPLLIRRVIARMGLAEKLPMAP
jgi:anti-anti-sigma factor